MTSQGYFDGLNQKLFAAIPAGARSVLEFGCANGRLGEAYKAANTGSRWIGIDANEAAIVQAAGRLDATITMDLDEPQPERLGAEHDVIVMGNVLEHLRDPQRCLRAAYEASAADAKLIGCVPNMTHASVIQRMLAGDLSYDAGGLLDQTHIRFLSWASTFKTMLDAGWLPNLRDRYATAHPNKGFVQHLVAAAAQLGIPPKTTLLSLQGYQFIIDAIKWRSPQRGSTKFAVIVPVNDRAQFELNAVRSPGLAEVQAEVVPVEGAPSAAQALAFGRTRTTAPWLVFCHQDVYFPSGTGDALSHLFDTIPVECAPRTLIGFAGLARHAERIDASGLIIDRTARFDYPLGGVPTSLDEMAVAMSANSVHTLDPDLGWHLWGTDLCLAADARNASVRIERIPLFHNSHNDGTLPPAFHESGRVLRQKYPGRPIRSLCATIAAD